MNKTITITLNGVIFHIEEDAYQKLSNYLNDIRNHLDSTIDKDEIIRDIEANIAEKFGEKIKGAKQVINMMDVEALVKVMGTVEDFDQELKDNNTVAAPKEEKSGEEKIKKLYRNPDDVIIAGVCSGIALYFGVETVIVRLIFGLSIFFGGFGVVIYLILWVIVPEAKTSAQKLEMQGERVTLSGIEQTVKKNFEKIKISGSGHAIGNFLKKLLALPFIILKAIFSFYLIVLKKFFPILSIFFGTVIIISMVATICALTFAGTFLIFNINSPYLVSDIPLSAIAKEIPFIWTVLSVYFIAFVPVFFILLLGITFARRKNSYNLILSSTLIGVWMLAISFLGAIGFGHAPRVEEIVKTEINQPASSQVYEFNNFNSVSADESFEVIINRGENYSIAASGNEKDISKINMSVDNSYLNISRTGRNGFCFICLSLRPVIVNITMPSLVSIKAEDRAKFKIIGFSGEELKIGVSDLAKVIVGADYKKLDFSVKDASRLYYTGTSSETNILITDVARFYAKDFKTDNLVIAVKDASRADLFGNGKKMEATVTDAGRLFAYHFNIADAKVKVQDVGRARINAVNTIEANCSDAGNLYYLGSPSVASVINDVGKVIKSTIEEEGDDDIIDFYIDSSQGRWEVNASSTIINI